MPVSGKMALDRDTIYLFHLPPMTGVIITSDASIPFYNTGAFGASIASGASIPFYNDSGASGASIVSIAFATSIVSLIFGTYTFQIYIIKTIKKNLIDNSLLIIFCVNHLRLTVLEKFTSTGWL